MKRLLAALLVSIGLNSPAVAVTINATFDPSVAANFGADTAAFESAFLYSASQFSAAFSDPISVNIVVNGAAGTGILGQNQTQIYNLSYADLRAAALADAHSASDATAVGPGGSLAPSAPAPGAWWVTSAQAKALGLAPNSSALDGRVTFGAGFSYTYDTNNRAVAGRYDMIGVMEQEISEVMGRIGLAGCVSCIGNGQANYMLLDVFSYTGARQRNLGPGGSFSINNGATLLKLFNSTAGGDPRDWASGTNDAFNAFTSAGVENALSAVDFQVMDVIGYDVAAVPIPGSLGLFACALALLGAGARRRVRSHYAA